MRKETLSIVLLALMLVAVILIAGCEINVRTSPRACTGDRIGFYRCSETLTSIEECAETDESRTWQHEINCTENNPADNYICDPDIYSATGIGSEPVESYCVPGCVFRHDEYGAFGIPIGTEGCVNDTTYGECSGAGQINWIDCSATGGGCYNDTCQTADQLQAVAFSIDLWYGQEMNEAMYSNKLNSKDLPYVLSSGVFEETIGENNNSVPYTQTIHFTDGTGRFIFGNDDGEERAGDYLFFSDASSAYAFNYTLVFEEPGVIYDPWNAGADIEGSGIHMLGMDMTISLFDASGMGTLEFTDQEGKIYRLEGGQEAEVNGVEIDGTYVHPWGDWGAGKGITVSYTPTDEEYIAVGESLVDPIFNAFEIELASVTRIPGDEIKAESYGADAEISWNNNDGVEMNLPMTSWDGWVIPGTALIPHVCEGRLYIEGGSCQAGWTTPYEAFNGMLIWVSDEDYNSHLLNLTQLDASTLDLYDITYDAEYSNLPYTLDTDQTFSLEGIGDIVLRLVESHDGYVHEIHAVDLSAHEWEFHLASGAVIRADEEAGLVIWEEQIPTIGLLWSNRPEQRLVNGSIAWQEPVILENPSWGSQWNATGIRKGSDDADTLYHVTAWGTKAESKLDENELVIHYPDEPVVAKVVIKSTLADVVTSPPPVTPSSPGGGDDHDDDNSGGGSGGAAFVMADDLYSELGEEAVEEVLEEGAGEVQSAEQTDDGVYLPAERMIQARDLSMLYVALGIVLIGVIIGTVVMIKKHRKKA
ncbi:hypothetical protein GF345_00865 [Candidatus Woesearchaeota archaeon]|nr:hypothetical protein [Candidatus Woesearchaeota archaeon]